jgi:hypothetical protein
MLGAIASVASIELCVCSDHQLVAGLAGDAHGLLLVGDDADELTKWRLAFPHIKDTQCLIVAVPLGEATTAKKSFKSRTFDIGAFCLRMDRQESC